MYGVTSFRYVSTRIWLVLSVTPNLPDNGVNCSRIMFGLFVYSACLICLACLAGLLVCLFGLVVLFVYVFAV